MPNFQNYINTGILLESMIISSEMSMLLLDKKGFIKEIFNTKIFNKLGYSYAYCFVGKSIFDIIDTHTHPDSKNNIELYKKCFDGWVDSHFSSDTLIGEEKTLILRSHGGDDVTIRGLLSKIELKNSTILNGGEDIFEGVVLTVVALEGIDTA